MNSHTGRKKILIFSLAYVPFVGGAELAMKEITDRLPEFEFHLITYRFDSNWLPEERVGNMQVFRVGKGRDGGSYYGRTAEKFLFMPLAFFKAWTLMREYRYELFWSLMASRAAAPALLMKLFNPRVPFFLTIQEGDTPEYAHRRAGILAPIWRSAFRTADRIQCISTYLKKWCMEEGADPERISVVPNGVDRSRFEQEFSLEQKLNLRRKLGLDSDDIVAISVSRLVAKNGLDILLQAAEKALPKIPKLTILLVGAGPEEQRLQEYAETRAIRTVFAGNIENADIPHYLAASDMFVRPSRSEGLGISFLEAMAAGVPIIGTPVGGITDFLEDNVTGFSAHPEDPDSLAEKLILAATNAKLKNLVVQNGRELVRKRYDWDVIAKTFGEMIGGMIAAAHRKNVVLVSGIFPPDIGGPATFSAVMFETLSKRGFDMNVLTYADKPSRRDRVTAVSRKFPWGLRHFLFLCALLWKSRSAHTILSADASMAGGIASALAARLLGKKLIVRVTGDYAWEQGQLRYGITETIEEFRKKSYGVMTELMRFFQYRIADWANVIVTPSKYLQRVVEGWGIHFERVTIIPNAEPEREEVERARGISREEARMRLYIPQDETVLVSAGRLVPWKGFRTLIEAFSELLAEHPRMRLVIAGEGPERGSLEAHAKRLRIEKNVFFLGKLPPEKLTLYLRSADLFVLNTGYEGFSHQFIEVMNAGIPIVTTPVGGNPEIITNRINGIFFRYNDKESMIQALKTVVRDADLRKKLSEEGKTVAAAFTVERMADAYIKLL